MPPLIFKPNGQLDIATAATDLPSQSLSPGSVFSEALTRCKNLRTDRKGLLAVRDGSSKINTSPISSGSELITNGTFATDLTGWTDKSSGGSSAWDAGTLKLTAPASSFGATTGSSEQSITTVSTAEHGLTFSVSNLAGGSFPSVVVTIGTTSGGTELTSATVRSNITSTITFTPSIGTVYIRFTVTKPSSPSAPAVVANIDNVICFAMQSSPVNLIVEQAGVRYEFAGAGIFRNEVSLVQSLTDAQWSAIKYNQFNDTDQQVFALNGTDRKRINGSTVAEWGITPPAAAPTVAIGTGTGLTGTYKAKITYCRKVSSVVVSESNPSSASSGQALANEALRVTWAASADAQVTHVRVYRTLANGSTYFLDQDVAIGAVTVDTTTADSALGAEVAINHDRPPLGQFVSGPTFDGTCFIVKENLLYYCLAKQPEYWPTDHFIEVSTKQEPGSCPVLFHNSQPFFFTKDRIYLIQGTGHGNLLPLPMDSKTGAQGIFGVVSVRGRGIYHTGPDGIYLFAGTDEKITERYLEPIFRGETVNGVPGVSEMETAWLNIFRNHLYFGYTSSGFDFPNNVLKVNLDTGRIAYYQYDDGNVVEARCVVNDLENDRLLIGDTLGFVRQIEDQTETNDSSNEIDWEVQSMDYTLQTRHHFPRYVKYDVDAEDADSCIGEILIDDVVIQTHTITDRNVRHRHIETANGKRCSLRISGTGPATIYAAELE